ncbi:MAG: hypothetical protein Q9174_000754 [Haloplaca sp. 1 TL-2023]
MAMRMAYALQLHRELDYDPLGRNEGAESILSATDKEIRRRTMWACFLMDRFNSSGTERPTCGAEEYIKVQLPAKESNFLNGRPGATETLDGERIKSTLIDDGEVAGAKDNNMGVASYVVRIIVLWGRVVKYLNLGGKEEDSFELWHPQSGFSELRSQAESFRASLPAELEYNADNLASHATERLANQFLFLHICYHQVVLFLHRYAIPTMTPGATKAHPAPEDYIAAAAQGTVDAADRISDLISKAPEHNLVAPFAGYCAFTACTVYIWNIFSIHPRLQAPVKSKLGVNYRYISKLKEYWGMFHFMGDNLKDMWKRHQDNASRKGSATGEDDESASSLFQYGDWFRKFPNGVPGTDYPRSVEKIKEEEVDETAPGEITDPRPDEDVVKQTAPSTKQPPPQPTPTANPKARRKASKPSAVQTKAHPPQVLPQDFSPGMSVQPMSSVTPQTSVVPSPFSPHASQPLYPIHPPQTYSLLPQAPDGSLLPYLDRNIVYDAYSQTSGPTIPSVDPSFQPLMMGNQTGSVWEHVMGDINSQAQALGPMGSYLGDMQQSSAWFMPFNMAPPTNVFVDGKGDYPGFYNGMGDLDASGGPS